MEYIVYAFAATVILYGLGLGFTLVLLPLDVRQYTLIVAPWVGYSYASLAGWELYKYGSCISSVTAQLILIPPLLCLVLVAVARGFSKTITTIVPDRQVFVVLLVAAAAFVFLSIPVFWNNRPTTVSLFNHDVASYATVTRFLMEFTRTSPVGFVRGWAIEWFNHYSVDGYFGPVLLAALLEALLRTMPDQDTTLCINLFAALGTGTVFLLIRNTLRMSGKTGFVAVALWAFHPAFQYLVLQGFFAQITAMSLGVLIFWTNSKLVGSRKIPKQMMAYVVLQCCFTWGLLLTYQHMLPFIWIFTAVHTLVMAIALKDIRPLLVSASGHTIAFVTFALLCPARAIAFVKFFRYIEAVQAGWFVPFFTPDYLAGLSYQNSPFAIENPRAHLVIVIITVAVTFFLLLFAFRNARRTTIGLWLSCSVVYAGVIILALAGENGRIGGYKSFKFASFFLPFFAVSIASLVSFYRLRSRTFTLLVRVFVIVAIAAGYVRADVRLIHAMKRICKRVEPEYRDLLKVDRDPSVQSVNILGANGKRDRSAKDPRSDPRWEVMWATYFLMHKTLYTEIATYWPQSDLNGCYDLRDDKSDSSKRQVPSSDAAQVCRLNDRFTLIGPVCP